MKETGRAILISLLILTSIPALGQNETVTRGSRNADSLKADNFYRKALAFSAEARYDSSEANLRKSLEIALESNLYLIAAADYKLLAANFDLQDDWEDALGNYLRASSYYSKGRDKFSEAGILGIIAAKYYKAGVYNKSAEYSEQEFLLYEGADKQNLAKASEVAAKSYFYLPDDSLSLKWYFAAAHYYLDCRDTSSYIRCIDRTGTIYNQERKYNLALEQYQILLSFNESKKDYRALSSVENECGVLVFREGLVADARDQFLRAVAYSEKSGRDDYFLTDVWSNLGICYQNLGSDPDMLVAFNMALQHAKESGRLDEVARIDRILANIHFNRKDNYHAETFCLECIEAARKSANLNILQQCYKDYSEVLQRENDFVKALEYYEKHLNLRDSLSVEARIAEKVKSDRVAELESEDQRIRSGLSSEEIQGLELKNLKIDARRRENELMLLTKQQELDRSEKNRLNQSLTLEKERFELNKRVQDIKSLRQQQAIDSLRLVQKDDSARALAAKNLILELDGKQKEAKIRNEKLAKRFAVGIGSLGFLVALIILYGLMSTRKKNQKLAESKKQIELINSDLESKNIQVLKQKEIIEQKNQSITDSIQYASRIQNAVLPPIGFLSDWGFDNFILYKPKDIVSGDFYWGVRDDNGKVILAAGDCTGHGVPGAFMSMLGHAFLDEIFNTKEIDNAAAILNYLREEVINTLKQKGASGEARDGMDISLVIIDRKAGKLDFAGANNPLYLIRDGKMVRYLADRMPIGIHFINYTPFTNHVVEIREGDYIYLFSDGYADQFGGPRGKKFMYKQFQDLLLRIHDRPMETQRTILENTFEKWKNFHEQVDDVMVIGLKV
jgi:serine phosphatase RsbU (regulator of sigma subunit)